MEQIESKACLVEKDKEDEEDVRQSKTQGKCTAVVVLWGDLGYMYI